MGFNTEDGDDMLPLKPIAVPCTASQPIADRFFERGIHCPKAVFSISLPPVG
jgi:hypothetical protein